jgi:hypothetical protein
MAHITKRSASEERERRLSEPHSQKPVTPRLRAVSGATRHQVSFSDIAKKELDKGPSRQGLIRILDRLLKFDKAGTVILPTEQNAGAEKWLEYLRASWVLSYGRANQAVQDTIPLE